MSGSVSSRARAFFQEHVLPTVAEWRASPTDLRLAMHTAVSLNQMADYFWHDFSDTAPNEVFNHSSLAQFRRELGVKSPSFALIRDVAEAHKHVKVGRTDRVLTSAGQTSVGSLGWGEAEFGAGTYGGSPEVVIELDSGKRRHFSTGATDVAKMWEALLASAGV
jgi:hypothetical protein